MKSVFSRTTRTAMVLATLTAFGLGLLTACDASTPDLPQYDGVDRPGTTADGRLRLNQLQVVGTHNSYHLEASDRESRVRALVAPSGERALQFSYSGLDQQFSRAQVRQIELDLWADPKGGLYSRPLLRRLTFGGALDPVMKQPGTKVLHIQDLDYHSNCLTFLQCLKDVKRWSDANPDHTPVAILIEFKDTLLPVDTTDEKTLRDYGKGAAEKNESTPGGEAEDLPFAGQSGERGRPRPAGALGHRPDGHR